MEMFLRDLDAQVAEAGSAHRGPACQGLQCEVITNFAELARLENEWCALYESAFNPSPPQSYYFVRASWEAFGSSPEHKFAVFTCRDAGRLVGLWAIETTKRSGVAWLQNPGFGACEEYAGPLVADGKQGEEVTSRLLQEIGKAGDVLKVTVPENHPLCRVPFSAVSAFSHEVPSPAIKLMGVSSFEDWFNAKTGSFRNNLRRKRRKLGNVEVLNGSQDAELSQTIIDWQFEEKRRYLVRRGMESSWIMDDRGLHLVKKLAAMAPHSVTGVEIWALLAGGVPAAGAVCFHSRISVELFMFVMNPEFSACSPGHLLLEDIARSSQERGVDFDFRITSEDYKLRWADGVVSYRTFVIALTPKGFPSVAKARFRRWMLHARRFGKRRLVALRSMFGGLNAGQPDPPAVAE
jgi:CelD/BcsL family acetyltransferase involved in cellulose biosynthesis